MRSHFLGGAVCPSAQLPTRRTSSRLRHADDVTGVELLEEAARNVCATLTLANIRALQFFISLRGRGCPSELMENNRKESRDRAAGGVDLVYTDTDHVRYLPSVGRARRFSGHPTGCRIQHSLSGPKGQRAPTAHKLSNDPAKKDTLWKAA